LTSIVIGIDHLTSNQGEVESITSLWVKNLFLILISAFGVGWISRRSLKETLFRLGLTKVSFKRILGAVLMGYLLCFAVLLIKFLLLKHGLIDPNPNTDSPLFHSIPWILTSGFAAGIGEETLFRGALLPRFVIILSAILFPLLHVHYGLSFDLLNPFVLGIILGYLRKRYNTTTTIIIHASYNMTIGLLIYLHYLTKL
jgi:hypothetical protein